MRFSNPPVMSLKFGTYVNCFPFPCLSLFCFNLYGQFQPSLELSAPVNNPFAFSPSSVAFPSFSLPSFPFYPFLFLSYSLLLYICSGSLSPYTVHSFSTLPLNCGTNILSSLLFSWFIVFLPSHFLSKYYNSFYYLSL